MSDESSLLLDKSYICPVCDKKIKAKGIKANVAKFLRTDMDLHPVYSNICMTKYDTVSCTGCGYTSLTRYFPTITPVEKMRLKKKLASTFKPPAVEPVYEFYSFDVALKRLKLALICAMYKEGLSSEIGYTCLKINWLYQDMALAITDEDDKSIQLKQSYEQESLNFSKKAYEYLCKARFEEDSPICGMDDTTFDYLLAALGYKSEDYKSAMRYLSSVTADRNASERLKDKAYDLKQLLSKAMENISEDSD